ncbi:M20/M25/M40 family metallo-hydrolase [Agromyces atrinae]|uniref:Acetylornithine deacetylase/succinyl-diaminopimelate desuccinylase-like protein n=1 Tax=Agromyces atrinae TaxID=592376 RepID=A0A4Q2M493_9MICO|nr:M20/M25/M40 family metallo-hydrolase [Agromyces atrinae]NYD67294.1 acetylornithine deacetylase/succinyl-diaminopimelate desuccinylase-like protein [Agromyces atrinae]RXZ86875.1 M20/M25/M40 family metallo-hydrolase [Agromyces atrinae]
MTAALELLEAESLAFIRDLIRIESVNTGVAETIGDGETRAARFVADRLAEVGLEPELVESKPGRGSVVARLAGSDPSRGALVVHAHLDVVPVEGQEWTTPPFGAEIHDGWLYGRGAVDMKNFAGTILAIARHFRREGIVPERDLIFAFFADEEAGGVWGARWLVENRPELFAGATEAISEVGGFSVPIEGDRRAYLVATGEKGVAWATLTTRGRPGHGSRPTADNSVVRLGRAVAAVGDHRFPIVRSRSLEGFLDRFGRERGVDLTDLDDDELDARVAELGVVAPLIGSGLRQTISPTVLSAGSKTNVIPAEASAALDVRMIPGSEGEISAALQGIVGDDVAVDWVSWIPPIESPADSPLLDVLADAIGAEDPDGVVVPYLLPASTDNKHLARLGIAGYGFVPLRVPQGFDVFAQFHTSDERIPVDALAFSARVTERILRRA